MARCLGRRRLTTTPSTCPGGKDRAAINTAVVPMSQNWKILINPQLHFFRAQLMKAKRRIFPPQKWKTRSIQVKLGLLKHRTWVAGRVHKLSCEKIDSPLHFSANLWYKQ